MYARITSYKMKPGSREAATAILNGLKADILALPGIVRFIKEKRMLWPLAWLPAHMM